MSDESIADLFMKGMRNPTKVPPYVASRVADAIGESLARIHTEVHCSRLTAQEQNIDDLRSEDEWMLIVLDACRFDYFDDLFDQYFEGKSEPVCSVAHDTFEFGRLCWPEQYDDVSYISGTPVINSGDVEFGDEGLNALYDGYTPSDHLDIVDIWKEGWNPDLGVCPPEPVTDAALADSADKKVVHYAQPHTPYIGEEQELGYTSGRHGRPTGGRPTDELIWNRVREGEITQERLHELYESNLNRVLSEVCRLVMGTETDRIIITSDHGEALGEYRMLAHPRKEHPHIRTVPWAEVSGVSPEAELGDVNAYESGQGGERDLDEYLKDLGYLQ